MELVSSRDEFQLELPIAQTWQIEEGRGKLEVELVSLTDEFQWNSSLEETRRLFPLNVLKQ